VILSGATNTKTACMSHTALTTDSTVYTQVREFVK
jgi:triacylglycerol lipase